MMAAVALALLAQAALATETLRPEAGPELRVHHRAGPLVALRLSVPVPPDLPEGAVELAQELARPEATRRVDRLGGTLDLRHEGSHAVLRVAGPAAALDELVAILRHATAEPDLDAEAVTAARARAEDRVMSRLERPEPRLRRLLEHRLGRVAGVSGFAAGDLGPEAIRWVLRQLYDPDAMRAVVVGDVPPVLLHAAFSHWPAATTGSPPEPPRPVPPPRPQAVGPWAALAYRIDADAATAAVAVALVDRRIRRSALRWGGAEGWMDRDGPLLVLLGGAGPDDDAVSVAASAAELPAGTATATPETPMPTYLRRMIAEARALAGSHAIEAAALESRRRMLLEARTPEGRAELIGRLTDIGEDPDRFLNALGSVDPLAVLRSLDAALAIAPVMVEITP